jgi:acetoin utilization deacetylase AcuC-like enzyme
MRVIYDSSHARHDPPYEFYDGVQASYAECASRVLGIADRLRASPDYVFETPKTFDPDVIREVHLPEYVDFIERHCAEIPAGSSLFTSNFISDTYTPLTAETYGAACGAVNVALTGAENLLKDESALLYALCRPPGHHSGRHSMGGYCYFNNAAVAAHHLSRHGKVALLDVDFHHGNGTQEIFYERDDVFYVSLHGDPRDSFPYFSGFVAEIGTGKGRGFNKNYPLARTTSDSEYLSALEVGLNDVAGYAPAFLVVSVGFDAYHDDPIGGLALTGDVYTTIGSRIASLNLPTLLVQEGGYHVEALPGLALNFLQGIERSSEVVGA